MSLAHPIALCLVALAVPVVLAYLRRAPPPERPVPSLLLLRRVARTPRPRRRRLEHLLSLALILAALALGAAGLALRPSGAPDVAWALVDDSASMSATAGQGTRLDRARAELHAWLRAHPDTRVGLVASAPVRVLLAPTLDHAAVRSGAAALRPERGAGDPDPLLRSLCAVDEPPQVLALSDAWTGEGLGCAVWRPPLGEQVDGRGLVEVAARRVDALGLVEARVRSTGVPSRGAVPAQVLQGGVVLAEAMLGAEPALVRFQAPLDASWVEVALPPDAMPADDRVRIELPPAEAVRAALLTDRPSGYLATALRAHGGVDLLVLAPDDAPPEAVDLLLVEAEPRAGLPRARVRAALGVDPRALGMRTSGRRAEPAVAHVEPHPTLRGVDLQGLHVARSWALLPAPGDAALVSGPAGVLAAELSGDGGPWWVLGFGTEDSDLPLRVAFVEIVANLVQAAAGSGAPVRAVGVLSEVESRAALVPATPSAPGWPLGPAAAALAVLLLVVLEWLVGRR